MCVCEVLDRMLKIKHTTQNTHSTPLMNIPSVWAGTVLAGDASLYLSDFVETFDKDSMSCQLLGVCQIARDVSRWFLSLSQTID